MGCIDKRILIVESLVKIFGSYNYTVSLNYRYWNFRTELTFLVLFIFGYVEYFRLI